MRKCIHCKKDLDSGNGYIKKFCQEGAEIETYICGSCKNQEQNKKGELKVGNLGGFLRLITMFLLLGLLGIIVHVLITINTEEYYFLVSLGSIYLILVASLRIVKCRLNVIQRVILVIISVLIYALSVGFSEYVLYLNYEGIAYSDMLSVMFMDFTYTLQFIFVIVPIYIISESYHFLSILGIIIGVWITTGKAAFSQGKVRYKKIAK